MSAMDWVRGGAKPSAALVAAVALGLTIVIVRFLLPLLIGAVAMLDPVVQTIIVTIALFGMLVAAAIGWSAVTRQPVVVLGAAGGRMAGAGAALGLGGVLVCVVYAAMAGGLARQSTAIDVGLLLLMTPLVFFQCAVEEVYFRGWIQPVLTRAFGPVTAIAVTAAAFALMHYAAGVAQSPMSGINVALAGCLFGLLAWRTGGLAAPTGAHFAWNWMESLGLGLTPYPDVKPTSVIDLDLTGPALWGGGPEGLNASLAVTFVMLAFSLLLALWKSPVLKPATV